jgi:Protein of unknown function (DUF3311)
MADLADRSPQKTERERPRPVKALRFWHYCALALPFFGLLYPPLYARWTPEIFGVPFFYAYQVIWIFLSTGLTAIVYWSIAR